MLLEAEQIPGSVPSKWGNGPLWVLGNPKLLEMNLAAIVGSRDISELGVRQTQLLATLLVRMGWCVVSGLARGVDRVAHETTLERSGSTIAVMGTPIEDCYPPEHKFLKARIAETGLVLSQFPPRQHVSRSNFPQRNGLMAALCSISFVVEAGIDSGTRHQVHAATKCGHKIGFLPALLENPHPWVTAALENGSGVAIRSTREAVAVLESISGTVLELTRPSDALVTVPDNLAAEFDSILASSVSTTPRKARGKKMHDNSILGQQGVNLIATIIGKMGFMWTPTSGSSDAGIDGFIEIRHPTTGHATNLIIQVQSKATTQEWQSETDTGFDFRCDERDIDYWLQGNAPVVLIVSRPQTNEAYWVAVKDYFQDSDRRKEKKVHFDKREDCFTVATAESLQKLAVPQESGLYLAPPPIRERLCSNLLPIARYGQTIYIAKTPYRESKEIWAILKESPLRFTGEWFLKGGNIISFHDLKNEPWSRFCKIDTLTAVQTDDWALSNDPKTQNDFAWLLRLALKEYLGGRAVRFFKPKNSYGCFYFAPTLDLSPRIIKWKRIKESERTVFGPHFGKQDPTRIIYYRHLAFEPNFHIFAGQWYLQITPTYHFTSDGKTLSKYRESSLSGIKRLEKHQAVRSNVEFWGNYISSRDLFSKPNPFISFADLLEFESDFGIPETEWLRRADDEERRRLSEESGSEEITWDEN